MWLLLVEDEKRLAGLIRRGLEEEGYTVDVAFDGEEGEILALTNAYDALIVDWRLPRQDGRQLVERLREEGKNYPILMLTALGDIEHKVTGLDAGADDYLPPIHREKPCTVRAREIHHLASAGYGSEWIGEGLARTECTCKMR